MRDFNKVAGRPATIATRAEWLKLQMERSRPKPQRILTPGNRLSADVQSQADIRQEQRIAMLRDRLDRAKHLLKETHSLSRLQGHARADFERGR